MAQGCMKCGYTRAADLVPVPECPRCGAIYAKVAAAVAQGKPLHRVRTSGFGADAGPASRPMRAGAGNDPRAPVLPSFGIGGMASLPALPHRQAAAPKPTLGTSLPSPGSSPFVDRLRRESLYPTFRAMVKVSFWLGIGAAAFGVIGAMVALRGNDSAVPLLITLAMATGWLVFVLLAREAALMIADLSDAAVRMAQRLERRAGEGSTGS